MFARLAIFNSRNWHWILAAWVVVGIGMHLVAPNWDNVTHDGDFAFLPSRLTSVRGDQLMAKAFPDLASKGNIVFVVARPDGPLTDGDLAWANKISEEFGPKEGVKSPVSNVVSYDDEVLGKKLKSPLRRDGANKGQAALVVLQLNVEFMSVGNIPFVESVYKRVDDLRHDPTLPKGLELAVSGSAPLGTDMLRSMEESVKNTEVATIALVVLILLVVYRAPGLVLIPLVAIGVSFAVAVDFIGLIAQWCDWYHIDFQIFKTTKIFIIVVLFGAATDYCLFLIARYREEMEKGMAPRDALEESIRQTGHALTASAMTTILGLGAMLFASFGKYRSGGPTIALSLVVALIACLTVAPALLRAFGGIVFWPFGVKVKTLSEKAEAAGHTEAHTFMGRFWIWLADMIVAHPAMILLTAFVVLAVPAYQGLSPKLTYDMLSELNPKKPSVTGTRLLEKYFSIGETGPITVLAFQPDGDFNTLEEKLRIGELTQQLADFEYTDSRGETTHPIQQVRSLLNPLGDRPKRRHSGGDIAKAMAMSSDPRCKAAFLSTNGIYSGKVTRFDLVCKYDPFSHEAMRLMSKIEDHLTAMAKDSQSPWHGVTFDFTGITPGIRDLDAVNIGDTLLVGQLVAIAVLAVLIFLLRKPVISLYLIFTVLLGFFVSLGITKTIFSWYYGDSFQGLDWKLPLFLFVILVAVGEDYNIYLVTRVFEEQRRRGAIEGLREAVIRTGGIITSCGVIMAGTFGSMTTGTLRGMIELGFAMSLGVLLDTFIIRTVLVPAFLALWARWTGADKSNGPPRKGQETDEPQSEEPQSDQAQFQDAEQHLAMAMRKALPKAKAGRAAG
jgi:RND superfamily putative drug exporter